MIIVDTGVWVGLADRRDQYHAVSREFFLHNREPLITTYPILVETIHLLFRRVGVSMTLTWLETVQTHGIRMFALQAEHLPRMTGLMRQYADLPMDLADASHWCCWPNNKGMAVSSAPMSGIFILTDGRIIILFVTCFGKARDSHHRQASLHREQTSLPGIENHHFDDVTLRIVTDGDAPVLTRLLYDRGVAEPQH